MAEGSTHVGRLGGAHPLISFRFQARHKAPRSAPVLQRPVPMLKPFRFQKRVRQNSRFARTPRGVGIRHPSHPDGSQTISAVHRAAELLPQSVGSCQPLSHLR